MPLLLLGVAGSAAAWALVAVYLGTQASWFAVLAAIDAAVLLRLGGMSHGGKRAAWAVLATIVSIALANWAIAFTQIGLMMGMGPLDSALRMGPSLAWTLIGVANHAIDLVWLVAALVVAWLAGR
ncbi:MAG: hypothetical protein L0H23_09650 [Luteimonas sp.]|nr:hypothetical protein [Luteimonas sp.]